MKSLLTIIALSLTLTLSAQDTKPIVVNGTDISKEDISFIELVGTDVSLFGSRKIVIKVDYGQKNADKGDQVLTDENGTVKFNSMIHALNYFDQRGWRYLNSYVVSDTNGSVYRYLLTNKKIK